MTRNLDTLLSAHKIAQQRRAAGKPNWDRGVEIKGLLAEHPDDTSEERAAKVANEIAARLRRQLPKEWVDSGEAMDFALLEIIEGMEALTPSSYDDDEDFSVLEDLNIMLGALYDWADIKRVWLA